MAALTKTEFRRNVSISGFYENICTKFDSKVHVEIYKRSYLTKNRTQS